MIQILLKMGMGMIGGVIAGPLGGAAAYALSDYALDEENEHLDSEELAKKYAVKFVILATGGAVAGWAGEFLGSSVGAGVDRMGEIFVPGDVSDKVAEYLLGNETVVDLFNKIFHFTANSCLPEEVKAVLISNYVEKFRQLIFTLINDKMMDELVGREITKLLANKYAQSWLEQKLTRPFVKIIPSEI
jgi:hypothetical protein